MNEVLKAIANRYSCRDFTGEPVTETQVRALADAALAAPSGMNRQPWHLIMITDKKLIDEMDDECMAVLAGAPDTSGYERIMARGGKVYYNAPCMALVASDNSGMAAMDGGILSQNIALAAHSLGLGSVICGMAGIPFAGMNKNKWVKRVGFPEGYGFNIAVLVGEAKTEKEPHELDYSKVTYIKPTTE